MMSMPSNSTKEKKVPHPLKRSVKSNVYGKKFNRNNGSGRQQNKEVGLFYVFGVFHSILKLIKLYVPLVTFMSQTLL